MGLLSDELFFQVRDADSEKHKKQTQKTIEMRLGEFTNNKGDRSRIEVLDLMAELYKIQSLAQKVLNSGSSKVLDITSMPKRFFFPLLKILVLNDDIHNLLVTYSSPASYTEGALYEDIDSWKNLPGFGGDSVKDENLIVSIGFLVENLKNYFSTISGNEKIKMLIPFPAPLAILKRTSESVSNIERDHDGARFEKYRVDTLDISSAYDYIESLASNSYNPTAFAPFGHKTTSVAMCLYAIQHNSAVYYPQPTIYHPEYSIGVQNNNPMRAVTAYWIKHDRENLYEIQKY